MRTKQEIIDDIVDFIESLRIYINQDGGDLEFVDYNENTKDVTIKILGACVGCEFVDITYNDGLEELLRENVPEVEKIKIIS